jgi:hypothetical protein
VDGKTIKHKDFLLPQLGPKLSLLAAQIHKGIGLFVLRGLSTSRYSPGDSTLIYLGIAEYIGQRRGRQDRNGNVLSM